MNEITLKYTDGSTKKFPKFTPYYDICREEKDFKDIVGIAVNNKVTSLGDYADSNCNVEFLKLDSTNGNRIYCAGIKMLFEYAVNQLYKNAKVEFLYDLPRGLVARISGKVVKEEELNEIYTKMKELVRENLTIEKMLVKTEEGIRYYKSLNNFVKASNMRNIVDPTVVMYRLDNLVNYYYYEMPYSTGVLNKFNLNLINSNIIHILIPNKYDYITKLDNFNNNSIINMYKDTKNWLSTMKTEYVSDIDNLVSTGNIENYIRSCELNLNININETVKYICKNKDIKFVMLAGPSSSGKTTIAKRIANYFEIYGKNPIVISIDDYYKERVDCPKDENGNYDFECLESLDLKYLGKDVKALLDNKEVILPKFNFYTGKKELSGRKVKLTEDTIIIFEGLHGINNDLLPLINDNLKYKIYACPYYSVSIDEHNYISNADVRLLRRIVRDFRTRGYDIESTLKNNEIVRLGEEKWITPFIPKADKIINTSLPYEIGVLKVFVVPLLYSVSENSQFYNEARRLLSVLKQFYTINAEYVPNDSILREFIGGGIND